MITELGELTSRIAALTSIGRTTEDDARREALHDGSPDEYRQRVLPLVAQLRKVATDLEKTVA